MSQAGQPSAAQVIAIALPLVVPVGLLGVLNYLRPDLMAPMLDHTFGQLFVAAVTLLVLGGTGLVAAAVLVPRESVTARVILAVLGVLACTLPAIALILFGPIVFAFMFGEVSQ